MMRWLHRLFFVFFTAVSAAAQEKPATYGYLEVVNAVVSDERLQVEINGQPLVRDGILPMACTGGFAVPSGGHQAEFSVSGIPEKRGKLKVETGKTRTYAVYLKPNPREEEREEVPHVLAIRPVAGPEPGKGFQLRIYNLCATDQVLTLNKAKVAMEKLSNEKFGGWKGGPLTIKRGDKVIGEALVEEQGTYHLYVSTDYQGGYRAALVRILDYELPPWLAPKQEE